MQAPRYDPPKFLALLRAAVEQAGRSNRVLAREAGMHPSQITRWGRETRPSNENLVRFATALRRHLPDGGGEEQMRELFHAAGWWAPGETVPALGETVLPDLVEANQDDEIVMDVWRSKVPEEAALGMIAAYLEWRDRQPQRQVGLTGPAPRRD